MPLITSPDDSTPIIASLIIVPIAILIAGTGIAIGCSERWSLSNNRFKRCLQRKENSEPGSSSTNKIEDIAISQPGYTTPAAFETSESITANIAP